MEFYSFYDKNNNISDSILKKVNFSMSQIGVPQALP